MTNNTGLRINSLFAMPPNLLSLCGSENSYSAMERCVTGGNCEGVAEEIRTFRTMGPYLDTIGKVINADPLSQKVAECYWLGNAAVFRFNPTHFELLLEYFFEQGEIPQEYIESLRNDPPKAFIPSHIFQVLLSARHGGGINEAMLPEINKCMVSWGRVQEVDEENKEVVVMLTQLGFSKNRLIMQKAEMRQDYNSKITPNIKPGNMVVCHWGTAVMPITIFRAYKIEKMTEEVLKIQHLI